MKKDTKKIKLSKIDIIALIIFIIFVLGFIFIAILRYIPAINVIKPKFDSENFIYLGQYSGLIPISEYSVYGDGNNIDDDSIKDSYPNEGFYDSYNSLQQLVKDKNILSESDFENYNYYLFYYMTCNEYKNHVPIGLKKSNNKLTIYLGYNLDLINCTNFCDTEREYYFVKLEKSVGHPKVEVEGKEMNGKVCSPTHDAWKPIIYIYPQEEMDINIKLSNKKLITTSYPRYEDGWTVTASPNGNLKYKGKNYYALYWEGNNYNSHETDYGFVIDGKNTAEFFEEKLEILGLNEREINEFIIFWLPKMEHNKYNYIRFTPMEELNDYMSLDINPAPDTLIRVFMEYKPLDDYKKVKEQHLNKVVREGYTVVEWGGSEIK